MASFFDNKIVLTVNGEPTYIAGLKNKGKSELKKKIKKYLFENGMDEISASVILHICKTDFDYVEAIENGYNYVELREWKVAQKLLKTTMKFETAMKISEALWEEGIEILELDP